MPNYLYKQKGYHILIPSDDLEESFWVKQYCDYDDIHGYNPDTFSNWNKLKDWLKFAVVKTVFHEFTFGKYKGKLMSEVIDLDNQYIEYCLREVDRFYLEDEAIISIIENGYAFGSDTIKAYKQKLTDLSVANYILELGRTREARNRQYWKDMRDDNEADWLNYGQWRDL